MSTRLNLAELKNNPQALQSLMSAVKVKQVAPPTEEETASKSTTKVSKASKLKKKKKIKKVKEKPESIEDSAIIIDNTEDDEDTEIKVRNDNDLSLKHNIVRQHIVKAQANLNQNPPIFTSMEILLSAAYRYAELKMRTLLIDARNLCKEAVKLNLAKTKAKDKAKSKGIRLTKADLKKFDTSDVQTQLEALFTEMHANLEVEDLKFAGKSYDNLHSNYTVDLSLPDSSVAGVVMARADLMVTVGSHVDLKDVKRRTTHIQMEHIEASIFAIRNALLIGYLPSALPKKIDEASLEVSMVHTFQMQAAPIPKQLRHPTSSRVWFYVPEYPLALKTLSFADRSLNSEFDALKSLSNAPSEEDVRFFFLRTGIQEHQINMIVRRWASCDSYQGRINILINEYNSVVRMQKNRRLREQREKFMQDNENLIKGIHDAKNRIENIDEEKLVLRSEFSAKASHTGNAEQGLPLQHYNRLHEAFGQIERAAVRGLTDSHQRITIRDGIRKDRLECRVIRKCYDDISTESKMLNRGIKAKLQEIDMKRTRAFEEISGK